MSAGGRLKIAVDEVVKMSEDKQYHEEPEL